MTKITYLVCVFFYSRKRESLRLCKTQRDADQGQHGGSKGANPCPPLWTVPTLQAGGDGLQRHRSRQPAVQVDSKRDCLESETHTHAHTKPHPSCRDTQVSTAQRNFVVLYLPIFTASALCFLLSSLQETYEAKRKEFLGDLQRKEEEMRQMFVNKVKETEAELKEKEREVSHEWTYGYRCSIFESECAQNTATPKALLICKL